MHARPERRFKVAAEALSKSQRAVLPKRTQHLCAECAAGNHLHRHTVVGCVTEIAGGYICECEVSR